MTEVPLRNIIFMAARSRTGDAGAISENEFEETFTKIPEIQPLQYKDLDKTFQNIAKILENEATNWSTTCQALVQIRSIIKYGNIDGKALATRLSSIQDELKNSVGSLRSQVARDACMTVAFIAQQLGLDFKHQAEGLLPELLRISGQSTKIMATSGITALKYVCKFVRNQTFLVMLFEELKNSKSKLIRSSICQMLFVIVDDWPEELLHRNASTIQQALEKGSEDADPTARQYSREGLQKAQERIPNFSSSVNTRTIPSSRSRTAQSYVPMRAKSDMSATKLRQPLSAASTRMGPPRRIPAAGGVHAPSNAPIKSQPNSRNASPKRQRAHPPVQGVQSSASSSAIKSNPRVLRNNGATLNSAAVPPRPQNGDSIKSPIRTPHRQISEPKMQHNRIRSPSPTRNGEQVKENLFGRRTPSNLRQPSAVHTPHSATRAPPVYRTPASRAVSQLASQISGIGMNGSSQEELINRIETRADGSLNPQTREALDQLARLTNENKISQWDLNFNTLFTRSLDLAVDNSVDVQVRCAAVRLLRALVHQKRGINQRVHHLVNTIVNLDCNELALNKELEELFVEIARSVDSTLVLPVLLNLIRPTRPDEATGKVCSRLRLLPHVLYNTAPENVDRLVDDVVPVLCTIYERSTVSAVRRDCVICLIVFKNKVGIQRLHNRLNATLEKLVEAYSKRHNMAIWQ